MAIFRIKRKKYTNGIDYNKDRDYSAEMEKAKAEGNNDLLASLEDERNRKIEGENLPYRKTYDYIDIGTKIEDGIRNNASPSEIKELTDARRDKAYQNGMYDIYKNDEIQKKGLKYYYDAESGAGVEHSNRPTEKRSYDEQIKYLLKKVSNAGNFEYDPEDDPVYTALKSRMNTESRRAASDVLADVQQQTGGMSSYAVSAASQAANNYNSKLNEEIPRLAELAYSRYLDKKENDRKALDYALKASDAERSAYEKNLNQFNKDREYARESYENAIDRYTDEDKKRFEAEMELAELDYKKKKDEREAEADRVKEARELVQHYEKNGISAPDELLAEADMSGYSNLNSESSSIYRNKLNLEAILDARKIENYSARTSKAYDDMQLNHQKVGIQQARLGLQQNNYELQKEKFDYKKTKNNDNTPQNNTHISKAEDLDKVKMTNRNNKDGVYIGKDFINRTQFVTGCLSGKIIEIPNDDGTFTYKYSDDYSK